MLVKQPEVGFTLETWLYTAWFNFVVRYRKTILGPAWILIAPMLFIVCLGLLFSQVNGIQLDVFIPHLTIGIVVWTLVSGFVTGSTTIFVRNRPQILQGGMTLTDIVMVDVITTILQFLHQVCIIFLVFVFFGKSITPYALVSLFGLILLIANGVWLTHFFGIIGARYRDLSEVIQAIMRIAFLATPIIWMPGANGGRGGVMTTFMTFNPFYHFLELIRAPLMGSQISPLSWTVVIVITICGFVLANTFHRRFSAQVPLWV